MHRKKRAKLMIRLCKTDLLYLSTGLIHYYYLYKEKDKERTYYARNSPNAPEIYEKKKQRLAS